MSVQEQELDELLAMLHPNTHSLFKRIRAERDLYKSRYEYLGKFVQISCRIPEYDWCELTAHVVLSVEKNCKTVDEAVDFVLGGNGEGPRHS